MIRKTKIHRRREAILGIELGSTRIKAVLIDGENNPIAQGSHGWENQLANGFWTYSLRRYLVWPAGRLPRPARKCAQRFRYRDRTSCSNRCQRHDARLYAIRSRRRNTRALSDLAQHQHRTCLQPGCRNLFYNIPLRWSISHLYQAILNGEEHGKISTI